MTNRERELNYVVNSNINSNINYRLEDIKNSRSTGQLENALGKAVGYISCLLDMDIISYNSYKTLIKECYTNYNIAITNLYGRIRLSGISYND